MISNGYTDSSHIVIQGGSNGGTLVAAVANQRPDLFRAVVSQAPVMDMLRYEKFTGGLAWGAEYGLANKGAADYLLKWSPLHTIKA